MGDLQFSTCFEILNFHNLIKTQDSHFLLSVKPKIRHCLLNLIKQPQTRNLLITQRLMLLIRHASQFTNKSPMWYAFKYLVLYTFLLVVVFIPHLKEHKDPPLSAKCTNTVYVLHYTVALAATLTDKIDIADLCPFTAYPSYCRNVLLTHVHVQYVVRTQITRTFIIIMLLAYSTT